MRNYIFITTFLLTILGFSSCETIRYKVERTVEYEGKKLRKENILVLDLHLYEKNSQLEFLEYNNIEKQLKYSNLNARISRKYNSNLLYENEVENLSDRTLRTLRNLTYNTNFLTAFGKDDLTNEINYAEFDKYRVIDPSFLKELVNKEISYTAIPILIKTSGFYYYMTIVNNRTGEVEYMEYANYSHNLNKENLKVALHNSYRNIFKK
jgi:hypothetical protein